MPPAPHLLQLVIQQYPVLGVNSQGSFIGTDKYKQRLIRAFPTYTELQVKQAVNHLSKLAYPFKRNVIVPSAHQAA